MLDVKHSIKELISGVYECQKRIIINRRFIRELESNAKESHTSRLNYEIICLQGKILDFQKELKERFHYSY